jgi:hypothetical protein
MTAALIAAIMTWTTGSAGPALKALAGASATAAFRTTTARAIVVARAAVVGTTTAIVASAIASTASTAKRPLKTLAGIAAYARRVAGKFFAGSRRAAGTARRARLSGKQNDVVLGDGRNGGGGDERVDGYVAGVGSFGFFLAVGAFGMDSGVRFVLILVETQCCMMLGAFMSRIGFRFGAIGSPAFFDFGMLFVGKLRYFRSVRILRFASRFGLFFFVFFLDFFLNLSFDFLYFVHFFVFKDGAASQSIHFRVLLHLFLLGFHDAGSQRRDLVVV